MVRLTMMDYFKDRPKWISGAYWGVKGSGRTSSDIVMVDAANNIIELQRDIDVGETRTFKTGHKVKVTGVLLSGRETYADVYVTLPAVIPEEVAPTETQIKIKIPNKDGVTYKIFTYTVTIPGIRLEPVIKPICTEGEEKRITCPDGTVIVTHICKKDPTTGINRWAPTGKPCPPLELGKVARILVAPDGELRAYEGMDITITASVMCGATPSNGEPAILLVDGVEIARKNTSQGFVSLKWTATAEPSRTHKICISVPKSEQCPMYGGARDCRTITVSRMIPGIEEQLRLEREEYQARLDALREERKRIREMSLAAAAAAREAAGVTIPVTEIIPTPPVEEVEPEEPHPGIIYIPSIPAPPLTEYPINIFIDGVLKGTPPLRVEIPPGTHTIKVELKNFTPLHRTVTVVEGQTLTITDLEFI